MIGDAACVTISDACLNGLANVNLVHQIVPSRLLGKPID